MPCIICRTYSARVTAEIGRTEVRTRVEVVGAAGARLTLQQFVGRVIVEGFWKKILERGDERLEVWYLECARQA